MLEELQLVGAHPHRVGQVRVGLMRATGLMRARLQVGGDGIADARQWLQLFRARLATLTAPLEMGARTQIRQRLDRLFDTQEPEVASAAEAVSTLETAAALRETSLTDAAIIIDAEQSAPRSADFSGNEFDRVGLRASPVAATSPGRVRFWRYATALRWGLPLVCVLLAILGFWWFGKPASPLGVPAATPDATTPPATMQRSTAPIPESDVQAVLASPDLPLLDGQLMPSQLAVMDQLRWWASTQPDSGDAGLSSRPVDVTPEPLDDAPATFAQLAAADRRLLQGFASLWPRLGTEQRLTLLDNARRWRGLDASGRERVVRRSQSFSALPAQARARARDSFILWQSLPPAERDGLVAAFAAFAALPPDQQRTVADGFSRLSPSEQAPWRFVEGERELLALAGRVFSFVPEVERGATLALLQSLDEADRDRLRQGTRRMSAWQREQLRKALLAEPVASRSDWLRRRLGG